MNLDDLKAKGFVQNADGSWSKPGAAVPLDTLEAHSAEQTAPSALDTRPQKRSRSKSSVAICRIRLTTFRKRLLDEDAISFATKPLRDLIAADLGIDDADPRVKWEWSQVETRGVEGVVVTVEAL